MSRWLEIGALVALCFFLPLYEAPKNIFCALFLVVWIVNRARARDFGGHWDLWDSLIAAWIASGFVVAAFAGVPGGNEWGDALDLMRYGSVAWLTKRSRYSPREVAWVFGGLVAATVIGLAMAHVAMWRGKGGGLQLNSVGHVNHTAIYLTIMLGVAGAWLFAAWRSWPVWARALALFASAAILHGLVTTASRGAIAVGMLTLLVLGAGWWRRSRVPLQAGALALAATVLIIFAGGAEVLRKHERSLESDNVLSYRGQVWSMAVSTWQRYPWFCVGMGNFGQMTPYRDRAARGKGGAAYDTTQALEFAHAHSLFLNTLAERGVIGSIALGALLAAWFFFLLRDRPPPAAEDEAWLLWGGAVVAWMVTVGVGLVNTTLHHEHGILAALLLGMWLSRSPKR
jgi:O-antigen ligase